VIKCSTSMSGVHSRPLSSHTPRTDVAAYATLSIPTPSWVPHVPAEQKCNPTGNQVHAMAPSVQGRAIHRKANK